MCTLHFPVILYLVHKIHYCARWYPLSGMYPTIYPYCFLNSKLTGYPICRWVNFINVRIDFVWLKYKILWSFQLAYFWMNTQCCILLQYVEIFVPKNAWNFSSKYYISVLIPLAMQKKKLKTNCVVILEISKIKIWLIRYNVRVQHNLVVP